MTMALRAMDGQLLPKKHHRSHLTQLVTEYLGGLILLRDICNSIMQGVLTAAEHQLTYLQNPEYTGNLHCHS